MKNRVEVFKGRRLKRGARIILKNKIHGKYGSMEDLMHSILLNEHDKVNKVQLVIYWRNGKPIASVYRFDQELMAFCKRRYRRKGYATACINALTFRETMYAHSTEYEEFWNHQKCHVNIL